MSRIRKYISSNISIWQLARWSILAVPIAMITGSAVALFLWLLERATQTQWQNPWLLFLLPVAGVGIHFLYKLFGKSSEAGNNLIIDEIHQPGGGVPARMTPLILATTVITHLFGGSAGREGTAVQMGGSLASLTGRILKLDALDTRVILIMGIAAGFGSVFGTPVTGAIFAVEVLIAGRIEHRALLPCFVASIIADITCAAWGIHHTQYHVGLHASAALPLWKLIPEVVLAGALFGIVARAFSKLTHAIKTYCLQLIRIRFLIPVIGGCAIILLTFILGTRDYLGLGVSNPTGGVSIQSSFLAGGATLLSWLWKLIYTSITLGTGFKGGEVTPLFFIGSAMGNAFATVTGSPVDLMAGLGFIAVFAGATNTPIACTLMGVELFGGNHVLYYALACFTAYYFSGSSGIYPAQRLSTKSVFGAASNDIPSAKKESIQSSN